MTTIETPPPAAPAPPPRRGGFYLPPWVLAVVGGLALLVIGFVVGRAVDRRNHHDGPFFRDHIGNGRHPLAFILVLIVLALIVTGIVLLVRHYSKPRDATAAPTTGTTAEQVLADRFARGEIDDAEFVIRRNVLRG